MFGFKRKPEPKLIIKDPYAKGTPIQSKATSSRCPTNDYLKPGVYTKTITDHPARINQRANGFHEKMRRTYNDYTVIAVNTSPTPDSMIMYITYSIGTPKC